MTSTEVVVRPAELVRLETEQIQYLANTEFVNDRIRGNLPMVFATIATGREVGIGDMAALRHIFIVDGKPSFSAESMVMLVRRAGHSITGEVTEGAATVTGTRADNGDTMTCTWTIAMADRAGLANKQNWRKYPEAMLWARAVSQLCRMLFSDCTAGFSLTPEELGEDNTDSVGEPIEDKAAASSPAPIEASRIPSGDEDASPTEDPAEGTPFAYDVDAPVEPAGARAPRHISVKQRERLFAIASAAGVGEEEVREIVRLFTGQESTKQIVVGREYDGIISAIQAKAEA